MKTIYFITSVLVSMIIAYIVYSFGVRLPVLFWFIGLVSGYVIGCIDIILLNKEKDKEDEQRRPGLVHRQDEGLDRSSPKYEA
jgi:hypothetical protein